ncbi:hypothetical protein DAPPUDRAFT_345428, partial [Daphnia pulex]
MDPAQITILVNNTITSNQIEDSFKKISDGSNVNALKDYYKTSVELLTGLIRMNVKKADAFQWQSQLKFYWVENPKDKAKDCQIRIADASFWYSYEYLDGLRSCWASWYWKDLDYKGSIIRIGKGHLRVQLLIRDELLIHGLLPEVLSVCSVQFKSVTDAVKEAKKRFVLQGDEIALDPTCGVFITMNPGYLGRAELPEGLKALFRPITVVVPDLELICENMLMAEGFVDAKVLAKKFVTLYMLCRDLLSKQLHYDWGLRAIKS